MTLNPRALALLSLVSIACIETRTPPEAPTTAMVAYGPKIYLRDATRGNMPSDCGQLSGTIVRSTVTGTVTTSTVAGVDETLAHNCYVEVTPGTIAADKTEVTNDLFQLCKDSGICKRPDPAAVEKAPLCIREDDFDRCPVASIEYTEAERLCQFIGKRLPTGIEHIVMRQATAPQSVADVRKYPYGNDEPTACSKAVLGSCSKPYPITIDDPKTTADDTAGAALGDVANGVFDLTGNVSEWAIDLLPELRGTGSEGLPWFCVQPLPRGTTTCPSGKACIRGRYKMKVAGTSELDPPEDRPICITSSSLRFENGKIGAVFGGNYQSEAGDTESGTFVRRSVKDPDASPGDVKYGIRCVGKPGDLQPYITPVLAP